MTTEHDTTAERLTAALHAHASVAPVLADAWSTVEERLGASRARRFRGRALVGAAAGIAAVLLVIALVAATIGDREDTSVTIGADPDDSAAISVGAGDGPIVTATVYESDVAEIFLTVDVTDDELDALRDLVAADDRIVGYDEIDREEAYVYFREIFADDPELVTNVAPENLPPSVRVTLAPGIEVEPFVRDYVAVRGVDDVIGGANCGSGSALRRSANGAPFELVFLGEPGRTPERVEAPTTCVPDSQPLDVPYVPCSWPFFFEGRALTAHPPALAQPVDEITRAIGRCDWARLADLLDPPEVPFGEVGDAAVAQRIARWQADELALAAQLRRGEATPASRSLAALGQLDELLFFGPVTVDGGVVRYGPAVEGGPVALFTADGRWLDYGVGVDASEASGPADASTAEGARPQTGDRAPSGIEPDGHIELEVGNLFFDLVTPPASSPIAPAGWVEITLRNTQYGQHELGIDGVDSLDLVVISEGDTATTVVWLDPGEHTLFGATPGHRAAGEELRLRVIARDAELGDVLPVTVDMPERGAAAAYTLDDGTPIWIVHGDDGVVSAVEAISPHDTGSIELVAWCPSAQSFEELQHGLRFDRFGYRWDGPAPNGLRTFLLDADPAAGNVTLLAVESHRPLPGAGVRDDRAIEALDHGPSCIDEPREGDRVPVHHPADPSAGAD